MPRKLLFAVTCFLGLNAFGPFVGTAFACPMCKEAIESEETKNRPKAYMYSILFMLAVPATVFASFGVGFYRLSKQNPPFDPEQFAAGEEGPHPPQGHHLPG